MHVTELFRPNCIRLRYTPAKFVVFYVLCEPNRLGRLSRLAIVLNRIAVLDRTLFLLVRLLSLGFRSVYFLKLELCALLLEWKLCVTRSLSG